MQGSSSSTQRWQLLGQHPRHTPLTRSGGRTPLRSLFKTETVETSSNIQRGRKETTRIKKGILVWDCSWEAIKERKAMNDTLSSDSLSYNTHTHTQCQSTELFLSSNILEPVFIPRMFFFLPKLCAKIASDGSLRIVSNTSRRKLVQWDLQFFFLWVFIFERFNSISANEMGSRKRVFSPGYKLWLQTTCVTSIKSGYLKHEHSEILLISYANLNVEKHLSDILTQRSPHFDITQENWC